MTENSETLDRLIDQLKSSKSAKRRAAAKKLRKLRATEAGPALLDALKHELRDRRTWETQYQMIMALGESNYLESFDFLTSLIQQDFDATMVYLAIGDAITRLELLRTGNIQTCLDIVRDSTNIMLIDGILRAIAMLRLKLDDQSTDDLIRYGRGRDINTGNRVWIAAAAPGWSRDKTKNFLEECMLSSDQQTRRAAEAALMGRYVKWHPL